MMSHFVQGFFNLLTCGLFDYMLGFGGVIGCFAVACSLFCSRSGGDF